MLLIGSRAARFHLPSFRDPLDWDFIAREQEISRFFEHPDLRLIKDHGGKKFDFAYGRTYVEVEIAFPGGSAESLLEESDGEIETPFGRVDVASLDALLLLKRSHVGFRHMWGKHFGDYKNLQQAAGCVPRRLEPILELRVRETKERLKFMDRDFSVSNDEFFGRSANRVLRVVDHDLIHESVKFGDVPIFKLLKDDQSVASVSYSKFCDLPFAQKVRNMQEECMVLTVERHAIPARLAGKSFHERMAAEQILKGMCFNYLPFDFRHFCIDYFFEILDRLPRGFARRAVDSLGISGLQEPAGGPGLLDVHVPGR